MSACAATTTVAATNPHWCILNDAPLVLQALNSAIKAAYAANSLTLRGWRDQGAAVDAHLHQQLQPAASSLQQKCAAGADSFASELTAFWLQPPLQLQQAGQPKYQLLWAQQPALSRARGHPAAQQAVGAPAQGVIRAAGRTPCQPHTCWESKEHPAHCLSSGAGLAW